MRKAALSEVKDDLSRFLRLAEKDDVVITRHGKPAGILVGFETEDDWFDWRLENDSRFLRRVAAARESIRAGRLVRSPLSVSAVPKGRVCTRRMLPTSSGPGK
jgi:prevent-host-death family protein